LLDSLLQEIKIHCFLKMTRPRHFSEGDLVFARIQGYPAWPARVTSRTSGGRYNVFFYGTYEEGTSKPDDMWPYNKKYLALFGTVSNHKYREVFQEALHQIEHTPEVAVQEVGEDRVEFSEGELVFARVKGYPVWPARVIGRISRDKYKIFFFGTSELGSSKPSEMWPYNKKYLDRLGPLEKYKKEYRAALYQIQNCPEIAVQEYVREFSVGDLVFARVKDYPAWPAQVTNKNSAGKYSAWVSPSYQVFLYGLCEVGRVKTKDLWPYNQEFLDKFEQVKKNSKWYSEGLYQIQHTPEIATQKLDVESDEDSRSSISNVHPARIKVSELNSVPILIKDLSTYKSTLANENNFEMRACQEEEVYQAETDPLSVSFTNESGPLDIPFVASSQENYHFNLEQNSCCTRTLASYECAKYPPSKLEISLKVAQGILLCEESLLDAELGQVQNEKVNLAKMEAMETLLVRKTEELDWLKTEQRLMTLVCQIHKNILSRDKETMTMCVEMLEEMEKVDIKPLMVIKVPEVYTMIKRLTIYANLDGDIEDAIRKEIVQRSKRIGDEIVQQFNCGASTTSEEFDDILARRVNEFKKSQVRNKFGNQSR